MKEITFIKKEKKKKKKEKRKKEITVQHLFKYKNRISKPTTSFHHDN
ncbi:hypothetical protein ACMBCN_02030 [Candidatus Liberibacter asiaticus]|nr:hypothetical protein [Candidatus Liberibacter asiaticus]